MNYFNQVLGFTLRYGRRIARNCVEYIYISDDGKKVTDSNRRPGFFAYHFLTHWCCSFSLREMFLVNLLIVSLFIELKMRERFIRKK